MCFLCVCVCVLPLFFIKLYLGVGYVVCSKATPPKKFIIMFLVEGLIPWQKGCLGLVQQVSLTWVKKQYIAISTTDCNILQLSGISACMY